MTFVKYSVLVIMVIMVVVVIIAAGCGTKDPLSPTTVKSDIMPLKVGNTWTYEMRFYNGPSQPPAATYVYNMEVTGSVTIGSETWYRTILSVPSVGWSDSVYFINRANGLYFRTSTAVNDSVYLRFKYPVQVGDTSRAAQEFLLLEFGFRSMPAVFHSASVTITVPYNTVVCYYQEVDLDPGETNPPYLHDYFRPNLGMVQSELDVYDGISTYYSYVIWELTGALLE